MTLNLRMLTLMSLNLGSSLTQWWDQTLSGGFAEARTSVETTCGQRYLQKSCNLVARVRSESVALRRNSHAQDV